MGGHSVNEWSLLVGEYTTRKRMATLGFISNFDELNVWEVEAMTLIDVEINNLQEAEVKKKHGNRRN